MTRPESTFVRRARQADLQHGSLSDALAMIVFVAVLVVSMVALGITLIDLAEGKEPSVLAAIGGFFDVLDGGRQ